MKFIPILLEEDNVAYINPEFVSSIVKNPQTEVTNLYMVGDGNPYAVNDDVEQLAKKISSASEDASPDGYQYQIIFKSREGQNWLTMCTQETLERARQILKIERELSGENYTFVLQRRKVGGWERLEV